MSAVCEKGRGEFGYGLDHYIGMEGCCASISSSVSHLPCLISRILRRSNTISKNIINPPKGCINLPKPKSKKLREQQQMNSALALRRMFGYACTVTTFQRKRSR